MLVAVLSDIHDDEIHLLCALALAQEGGCTHLLFAGDMAESGTLRLLLEEWPHGMDLVFGNNEGERSTFARIVQGREQVRLHGDGADFLLDGRRIYLCHYPHAALRAAVSGAYDAAFYGHTHQAERNLMGNCLLANPGEVCGQRSGTPRFGLYNTQDNSFHLIRI